LRTTSKTQTNNSHVRLKNINKWPPKTNNLKNILWLFNKK